MLFKAQIVTAVLAGLFAWATGAAMSETGGLRVSSQMLTPDGDVKSCSSRTAYAIPVSKKSTRVMKRFYDSDQQGFVSIYSTPELIWSAEGFNVNHLRATQQHRLFQTKFRNTQRVVCDEDGTATFEKLQARDYYVIVPVFWKDSSLSRRAYYATSGNYRSNSNQRSRIPANYIGGTLMARITVKSDETQNVVFAKEGGE